MPRTNGIRTTPIDICGRLLGLLVVVMGLASCTPTYVTPDRAFLESQFLARYGISDFEGMTVQEYVDRVASKLRSDGTQAVIHGWERDGNIYTLHVDFDESLELEFEHILAAPSNGRTAVLRAARKWGESYDGLTFTIMMGSMASVPVPVRPLPQLMCTDPAVTPAAHRHLARLASDRSATQNSLGLVDDSIIEGTNLVIELFETSQVTESNDRIICTGDITFTVTNLALEEFGVTGFGPTEWPFVALRKGKHVVVEFIIEEDGE
jgi:hypothetical protein